jgi:predicted dehydrogenase
MPPTRFAIIGPGWRSGFYRRIVAAMPDRFEITGVLTRDAERAEQVSREWGLPAHTSLDDLLRPDPTFVLLAVPWPLTPVLLAELVERGVPVLCETPPAPDVDGLRALAPLARRGARVQVCEQYQFQPMLAARLAIAASGRIGTVSEAQVSVAHGYHGIDLMRRFLGIDDATPMTIRATRFQSPLVEGPTRQGPPAGETIRTSSQLIGWFDLGDRLGVMDHTDDQYWSWVRGLRILVRGERGEIDGTTLRYLAAFDQPVTLELTRHDVGHAGSQLGYHHEGITAGAEWVYRNPFPEPRLPDEEVATATLLTRMAGWLDGGPDVCSLSHGAQDHYLYLAMQQAATSGEPVRVTGHVWD